MPKIFKVATRSSPLAMRQAEMAVEYFSKKMKDAQFEIVPFKTTGDKRLEWSLEKFGGKGLFTKELEEALLNKTADFAVHSAKDMPVDLPNELALCCFLPRDDCRDVLVYKNTKAQIKKIATSSPRRRVQLKKIFKDAEFTEIRGNVGTRLGKILQSDIDATMLSSAGLDRLGIASFEGLTFERLDFEKCVPAASQGIIAIQTRLEDSALFAQFSDPKTELATRLERKFLATLEGGCQVAFGANFDGKIFRIFHEKTGYLQYDFSALTDSQKESKVEEIADKIKSDVA